MERRAVGPRIRTVARVRRGWRARVRALVGAALLVAAPGPAPGAAPASPALPELPLPDLVLTLPPPGLQAGRPAAPLLPVPPVAAPALTVAAPALPAFATALVKPAPPVGGLAFGVCAPRVTPSPGALADCGIDRLVRGDREGGRQALTESLALDPLGGRAAAAHLWLGEVALHEGRDDVAERRYGAALGLGLRGEAGMHAALGGAWAALRRGAPAEARRWLADAAMAGPSEPLKRLARFLDGVAQLLEGRPAEALAGLEGLASAEPAGPLATELLVWRGVALARLGRPEALPLLDRFAALVGAEHPLRSAALVHGGYLALRQGAPAEAERRFLEAEAGAGPALEGALRLGRVHVALAAGDARRAVELARGAAAPRRADAGQAVALLLAAEAAARAGLPGHAEAAYRHVLGLAPDPALADHAAYRLGELLEAAGQPADAEDLYRRLRDQGHAEPLAQRATYRLGLRAYRARDWAGALREGEGLLRAGTVPELRAAALLLTAAGAAAIGDAPRAGRLYRAALDETEAAPWVPMARVAFGWAALDAGDPPTALAAWQRAAAEAEGEVATLALLATAEVALREGQDAEALRALRLLVARPLAGDANESARLNLGVLAARAGRPDEAVAMLEPLRRSSGRPLPAALHHALGLAHFQAGRPALAEQEFRQAAALAPAEGIVWLGLGLAVLAQGRIGEAEAALARAQAAGPPALEPLVAYGLVVAAARSGDGAAFGQRASSFVERHRGDPAAATVLGYLVAAAIAGQSLDEADGWTQRLLRDQPRSPRTDEALLRLGRAAQGPRPELARRAFRDLIARQSSAEHRAEAWLGLAQAAAAVGDDWHVERALTGFLADVASGDPRLPEAYGLLVRALAAQGHRARALSAGEAFLARARPGADAAAIQLLRGELLLQAGRWDAARAALEAAGAEGEPAVAAAAHVRLGEALHARGEPEAAIAAYLSTVYLYPESPRAIEALRGAAEVYLSRRMPREAGVLLRKLLGAPGVDGGTARWARDTLRSLERPGQPAATP